MNSKQIPIDPKNKEDIKVSDILKNLFRYQGIEFESVSLIHWRIIDDNIVPQAINTLGDVHSFCRDGKYHLAITKATISRIEKEPFRIPEINIEVSLVNGQWSEPRIYTDTEECSLESATPEALESRLEKITVHVKEGLQLIHLILKIAEIIRDLWLG